MSRFGGVTLEEASSAWHSKEDQSYNSNYNINNSTNTLDTNTLSTTNDSTNLFGVDLGFGSVGRVVEQTKQHEMTGTLTRTRRAKPTASSRRRLSAREFIDKRKIQSRAAKFPEDWPQSTLGPRRRSCNGDTVTLPCVKKAVSHLELLQTAIEEWFLENPNFAPKDRSTRGLTRVRSTWHSALTLHSKPDFDQDDDVSVHTFDSGESLEVMEEAAQTPFAPQQQQAEIGATNKSASSQIQINVDAPILDQSKDQNASPASAPARTAVAAAARTAATATSSAPASAAAASSVTIAEKASSAPAAASAAPATASAAAASASAATAVVSSASADSTTASGKAAAAEKSAEKSAEKAGETSSKQEIRKESSGNASRATQGLSPAMPGSGQGSGQRSGQGSGHHTARATRQTHVSRPPPLSSIASSINFDEDEEEEEKEEEEGQFRWASIIPEEEEDEEGGGEKEKREEEDADERFQLPEINAEDIVAATTMLLRHLERDRNKLDARLRQEDKLIVSLQTEIDALMIQRMKDLPVAVQREHESCMLDVTELQWHVNYRGRVKTRTNKKVNKAKEYNTKLRTELEHISKQGPLIQEKLCLLSNAMIKIAAGQETLEKLLSEEQSNHAKIESRSAETRNKAQMERGLMVKEQRSLNEELGRYEKDLVKANELHDQLTHEWNSFDTKMTQAKASAEALDLRIESVTANEEQLESEIRDLQIKIREQELEASRVFESNEIATKEKERDEDGWRQEAENLEITLKQKTKDLQNVMKGIKDFKGAIDETLEQIRGCQQDKVLRIKNQESHQKEISKNEEQIEFVKLELEKAEKVHSAIGGRLDDANRKIIGEENELRNDATIVRTQIKDERQSKMSLNAKILTDRDEGEKLQKEAGLKMEKIRKKAAEVESVVDGLDQKVEKLRNSHEEKSKVVQMLEDQMRHIKVKQAEKEVELHQAISELEPVAEQLGTKQTDFGNKQKFIEKRSAEIKEETQAMESEEVDLNEELQQLEVDVEALEADLNEMQTQYSASDRILREFQRLFDENQERMSQMKETHTNHIQARNQVFEHHKTQLWSEKVGNTGLASSYRRLVGEKLRHKSRCLDTFDKKNRVENSLKDLRLLRLLQERMSTALQVYFRLRGLYGSDVVADFKDESQISSERMDELKVEMGQALGKIDNFLKIFAKTA